MLKTKSSLVFKSDMSFMLFQFDMPLAVCTSFFILIIFKLAYECCENVKLMAWQYYGSVGNIAQNFIFIASFFSCRYYEIKM